MRFGTWIALGIEKVLRALVWFYKLFISPLIGPRCRYTPTCSDYMLDALKIYGPFKGVYLGVRRVGKCHPWGGSGYDPVPAKSLENRAEKAPKSAK